MKDTYVNARLVEKDLIRFVALSDLSFVNTDFSLIIDEKTHQKINITRHVSTPNHSFIEFRLPKALELGHSYFIYGASIGKFSLDVSEATTFPSFDENYYYDGKLGAIYEKNQTTWKIWAPLASNVSLILFDENGESKNYYEMKREDKGVYSLSLKGDYNLRKYLYSVTNNEITAISIDPYGLSSTTNAKESVVIDEKGLRRDLKKKQLPKISKNERVIYEANVRDFTIDLRSSIKFKGLYKGLTEKGARTKGNNPAGLDYLSFLGITHLQLQPLNDFGSVDETKGFEQYNWGYDPIQFFTPEGSYSADPSNPLSRIKELQEMIEAIHQAGIRVVLDVVFNHVYEYLTTSFEKIVPNYCFRKDYTGRMSNSSGCGDDLASEKPMIRKLIVDSCLFWADFYQIDGLRFDLMGLIDVETIKEVEKKAKELDKEFLIYGEGWDMYIPSKVPGTNMNNAFFVPNIGFFNDFFRENVKSYCAGDLSKKDAFIFSFLGSNHNWGFFNSKFADAKQSINYVECHDNATYYDFLTKYFSYSEEEKMEIAKFALSCVIFSFGNPFIHMGQEIAQSKFMNENTYNAGDIYNKLSDNLLDERFEMAQYCRGAILTRKELSFFSETDPRKIAELIDFEFFDDGIRVKINYSLHNGEGKYDFLFNPTNDSLTYSFDEEKAIFFTSGGPLKGKNILAENVLIPRHSLMILKSKK